MPLDAAPKTESHYLRANGVEPVVDSSDLAEALEASGWENWLLTLFPFAAEEEFSADHRKFWTLYWSVLMRIREQRKYFAARTVPENEKEHQTFFENLGIFIAPEEYVILLILGRGLAKSSTIEMSAVMRGAILDGGYCLYVCEAQDQADEHIGNCRGLIEHEESRLVEFYPKMAIDPNAKFFGMKVTDKADIFITKGGWICRSRGLFAGMRGLRKGGRRPDDIKIDDIDGVNDSIAVSVKKLKQITASLIPTQARRHATISFGQNLISENGVMTQIHTGKSDALAERTTVGVSNTFVKFEEGIDYVTYFDEKDGRVKHRILDAAETTWSGVDRNAAQKFINDAGLETFIAEYQNSFAHMKTEKVFHEWSEARHIITWSDFENMFGTRYIPAHWQAKASADLGYSKESLSAWMFVAAAAQNSPLPKRYFVYRGRTFCQDSIDDQAESLWEDMFPDDRTGKRHFEATQNFTEYPELFRLLSTKPRCADLLKNYQFNAARNKFEKPMNIVANDLRLATEEDKALYYVNLAQETFRGQIGMFVISHEKTGEQKTLAQKYGIPARKTKDFKADSGVAEANHLLKGDYTQPHPFFDDEMTLDSDGNETGLYKFGAPFIYFIVDDEQELKPKDDDGLKNFREQIAGQRWTQEKLTELGLTRTIPMKYQSDACLIAGTRIETSRGKVPIEQIKKGDLILTRKGYRKCFVAGMTNPSAEIYELKLSDGRTISGTGNHPIWVEDKGFIELCLVSDTDRIFVCENGLNTSEKLLNLMVFYFTVILRRLTDICGSIIGDLKIGAGLLSTLLFGNLSMAQFQKEWSFITKTKTHSTTIFPILSLSNANSIPNFTDLTLRPKNNKDGSTFFNRLKRKLKIGTKAMPDVSGTDSTLKILSLLTDRNSTIADFVIKSFKAFAVVVHCIARTVVSRNFCITNASMKQVSVASLKKLEEKQAVYNLSVEDVPEYFANGVLVHNCDAFRMFAVDYQMPETTPLTVVEKFQRAMGKENIVTDRNEIISIERQMEIMEAKEAARKKVLIEEGYESEEDYAEDY